MPINAITLHASYAILTLYAMSNGFRTDHELTFLTRKKWGKGYKHIYHQHHATMRKRKKKRNILLIPPSTEKQK